jgi:hypothetical protein
MSYSKDIRILEAARDRLVWYSSAKKRYDSLKIPSKVGKDYK